MQKRDSEKRSWTEAVKRCRRAAEQGDAKAQNSLGVCYANGRGVERSLAEAAKWFRKAAEQGDAKAQCNLGWCYKDGKGVERSLAEAAKWWRRAAQNGYELSDDERKIVDEN